jgi:hypothetical protein
MSDRLLSDAETRPKDFRMGDRIQHNAPIFTALIWPAGEIEQLTAHAESCILTRFKVQASACRCIIGSLKAEL